MFKSKSLLMILIVLIISGCRSQEEPVALPSINLEPVPVQILISEVFTGVEGNNQADFIELYNVGTEIADLKGYSLWYQLNDSGEEILLYRWSETSLIPPLGHFLLIQAGQQFNVEADALINQPLVPTRGGLSLRIGEKIEDQLTWGEGPAQMTENHPAIKMGPEISLQRNLEKDSSNPEDTDNNQIDFSLNPSPDPQNTGSLVLHELAGELQYTIDFPQLIKPGSEFSAELTVHNNTGIEIKNILVIISLPEHITLQEEIPSFIKQGNRIEWQIPNLQKGDTLTISLPLQAAFTFSDLSLPNSYLEAENWPLPAFNGPVYAEIGGGAIPITTARELIDKEVVVEGISTMYVGGFYAGSGAKFYIEDETGGIQVYVSGAGASLIVPIGAKVRVRGKIELYRDSIELIPASEDYVEIISGASEGSKWPAEQIDIEDINTNAATIPGKLVEVEGRVARIEEFSFSFEIDLFDEKGQLINLYLDKGTGISIEDIEADHYYRVTGIMELFDGNLRLYPRLQSDLARVFPPGLYIQAHPPTTAGQDETFTVTYTITNHALETDSDLKISAGLNPGIEVLTVHNGGDLLDKTITWIVPELTGGGESYSVQFEAKITGNPEFVEFSDYVVWSEQWSEPSAGLPTYTFIGNSVPIWAIQGTESRSPYVLSKLQTEGVVTGVFPELEGFWIQEIETDDDPSTSAGIFVNTGLVMPPVAEGDFISVTGRVREAFQQTQLEINSPADVTILGRKTLPNPIVLDPPADNLESALYYESLEGTLVSVPGTSAAVGPTTRYGEFAVVLSKHGISRAWQGSDQGMLIYVDDGSSVIHESRDSIPDAVTVGDTVSQLIGPLAYTFGNYKIEPTADFSVATKQSTVTNLEPLDEGYFSIMTWNVENLFDFVVPHPSSPPLPSVSEYKRDITKVADTILMTGLPTIIGFQEVESLEVLEDIAAHSLLVEYHYQPVLIEGTDSRGIDVGYLVRGDQVKILDQVQYPSPGNITSRPPLLVKIQAGGEGTSPLYILNNHFTSMSGGELATEPRRNAQADWNLQIALEILNYNPDAYLAVIGDLNSYYKSLPLETLQEGGLSSVFDTLPPEERYTYVYEGVSQVLDHILINEALKDLLVRVEVLHSNADFPLPFSSDESYWGKSDHDPLIATFILP
ncbi:MAG: lamin tail domain-containing protein [Anaerolineales bacterium]|nr:lamin tail domain-containing protein [Anaerolineales bacterium]